LIVEFIGSTGAGKTTLIEEVRHSLAKKVAVATPFDLVAERLGVRGVTNLSAQHLIQELVGLPFFLRALNQHKEFVVFTLRMLARQANFTFFTINNLRSLERKIAAYEMIRRMNHERIILVDEGTVLTAHNVFVYTSAIYTPEEIARFASLVPLPDTIVYIKAPVDVLVQRSLQRTDPPREIKSKNRTQIEKYIVRAASMFDQLVKAENIQCRLIIVEYHDFIKQGYDTVVDRITDFVLDKKNSIN
jgi:thymidylate kinase